MDKYNDGLIIRLSIEEISEEEYKAERLREQENWDASMAEKVRQEAARKYGSVEVPF